MKKWFVSLLLLALSCTANASLSNLDSWIYDSNGNAINLGQQTMTNSLPVVFSSNQTPLACSQNGTWTVQQGTPPWSVSQSGTWNLNNISGTVSLPTGASTSALQTTGNSTLSTISGQLPTTLGAKTTANSVAVNIASDQTVPVSAASLPLPAGAATSALQTTGNSTLSTINTTLGSPMQNSGGSVTANQGGTWNINNVSGTISLPTGAATSANQSTEITSLGTIGTNTSNTNTSVQNVQGSVAAGTAATKSGLAGAVFNTSAPTLTNGQQAALQANSSGSLKVDGSAVTQPVSGTVAVSSVSGTVAVTQSTTPWVSNISQFGGSNVATGTGTSGAGIPRVTVSNDSNILATQSGTWSVTANAGTNLNTSALALESGGNLASIKTDVDNLNLAQGSTTSGQKGNLSLGAVTTASPSYSTAQSNPLSLTTAGALRVDGSGVTQPVNGTVTSNQGTSPWVNNISQFGGSNVVTGTGASGAGIPRVTVANDSNVLATQSGTWNINNVSGTVSLPTGAATSALQTTGNTALTTINTTLGSPMQNSGGSVTANQGGTWNVNNVSGTISLPTGAATSANQSTEITSLGTIGTNTSNTNTSVQNTQGPVGAGTAATKSDLIGGVFNTSLPTLTTGQQAALQVDSSGRLQIAPVSTNTIPPSGSGFAFGDIATSATTQVKVERTTYTEQSTNTQMSIASSSANDTVAGTGAQKVMIKYMDATGAGPNVVTISMSGTTFVNAGVSNMCFIENISVSQVGSTLSNVGTLTLKSTTAGGGATVGTVSPTDNRTFWGHHYTPTGKTSYISGFSFSSTSTTTGAGAVFTLSSISPSISGSPLLQISDFNTLAGSIASTTTRSYISPIQVVGPARTTILVTPASVSANTQRASFDYIDN